MFITIKSKDNRILKQTRSLTKRKYREQEARFLLEGKVAVEEALQFAEKPDFLVVTEGFLNKPGAELTIEKASQRKIELYQVTDEVFATLTQTKEPQGVLLVVEKQECLWQERSSLKQPLWVVVDGLQDPGNLGTIIRTSAAAGAERVILTRETVDLYNDKVLRSTMGAIFRVKVVQGVFPEELISHCCSLGLPIVVADPKGSIPYYEWDFTQGMALVIGSEFQGPNPIFLKQAQAKITIPMPGELESLNAGVAGGILMFERVRQQGIDAPVI